MEGRTHFEETWHLLPHPERCQLGSGSLGGEDGEGRKQRQPCTPSFFCPGVLQRYLQAIPVSCFPSPALEPGGQQESGKLVPAKVSVTDFPFSTLQVPCTKGVLSIGSFRHSWWNVRLCDWQVGCYVGAFLPLFLPP